MALATRYTPKLVNDVQSDVVSLRIALDACLSRVIQAEADKQKLMDTALKHEEHVQSLNQ